MMDEETWFTSAEAQSANFIDSIIETPAIAAKLDLDKMPKVTKEEKDTLFNQFGKRSKLYMIRCSKTKFQISTSP